MECSGAPGRPDYFLKLKFPATDIPWACISSRDEGVSDFILHVTFYVTYIT